MRKGIQFVLGLLLAAVLIWWLFRGVAWAAVGNAIMKANLWWIAVSIVGVLITFVTRVLRWRYIVRTAGNVSFRHMYSATQIGFLGNFILPARAGEAIRALVLGRLTGIPFSRCLAFVALDRVTDLFGLMAVILVTALAFRPEADLHLPAFLYNWVIPADMVSRNAFRVAMFILAIVGVFVLLYVKQQWMLRVSDRILGLVSVRLAERVHELLQHFAEGFHVFRSASDMAKSIFFSLVTWAFFVLTYDSVLLAFDLTLPWYAPFVILSFLAVAISVPGTPGFVGQFHFGVAVPIFMLMPVVPVYYAFADASETLAWSVAVPIAPWAGPVLAQLPRTVCEGALETVHGTGLAVAVIAHLINVFPVFAVGVWCLYREKFGLLQLQRETETAAS